MKQPNVTSPPIRDLVGAFFISTEEALTLNKLPLLKPFIDIPRMADVAQWMVKNALDAFVNRDVALADAVRLRDDELDSLRDQIFRELLTYMMVDPATIDRAIHLILVSRHLERVGDHACNIAEDVVYVVQGRIVRHHQEELRRSAGTALSTSPDRP